MKQCGVVTLVKDKTAKVLMQRHSSCGSCNACKMGQEDMKMEIEAINDANAKLGERVEVDMEGQSVLTAAFIVYVIPLLALVIGVLLATTILPNLGVNENMELYAALIGFTLMFFSFIGIRKKENVIKNSRKFTPVIVEVIDHEEKI
ncbi:positive regulator of sigma(E), RseC/MucC [Anaerovirgula multivorans]|uniref:Positive regulator of sigma(E), RseC/MucC n=1 Tax=Anaerovirgula multivorans TaxID=312168 RepID=A0A239DM73_9FIRM|nr:SoxR reducing system RseC family protein [Anaerovirgula multivorans]SNS33586.1 positive regulator of sigma(E), RseC/MucC [Anaerovirgula multivorans]